MTPSQRAPWPHLPIVRFDEGEPDSLELAKRAVALVELLRRRVGDPRYQGRLRSRPRMVGLDRRSPRGPLRVSAVGRARRRRDRRPSLLSLPSSTSAPAGWRSRGLTLSGSASSPTRTAGRSLRTHLLSSCRSRAWRRSRGTWMLARELAERTLAHPGVQAPFAFYRAATALLATLDAWSGEPARAVERFAAIEAQARADGGAGDGVLPRRVRRGAARARPPGRGAALMLDDVGTRPRGSSGIAGRSRRPSAVAGSPPQPRARSQPRSSCSAQAVAEHEAVGDPFGRARALLALGVTRRRARQKRSAREAVEAALAGFEEIGAAGWAEKARGRAGPDRRPQREEGLTPAERRVANLVAEGKTNREVAAALFLGERTVASHLTHIYAKLGVRSRTELARQHDRRREQSSDVLTFPRRRCRP